MMRKKRLAVAILILCVIIVGLFFAARMLFNRGTGAEVVVNDFLSAVSKDDSEKAKACLVDPNEFESLTTVAKNMGLDEQKTKKFVDEYTSIKYSVEKTVKGSDDNQSTVMLFMTVPDYSSAFTQGLSDINDTMTPGQALKIIIEKMADSQPAALQKAIAVNVVKKDDKWLIDYSNNNVELLNAVNGNVMNALHGNLAL